ncbi:MAG: tetrahydrofolate dehydrogenase/cyclohydrolase catalytic domain-containing protein, partial [Oscillospiraceae bacterium]
MLIDGKKIAFNIKEELKQEVVSLNDKGISISLSVIIVGDDKASRIYVNSKKKTCQELGINSTEYALPQETTQDELLSLVKKLNDDEKVNGILVQLPLPSHINENEIIKSISPQKDVDAFH